MQMNVNLRRPTTILQVSYTSNLFRKLTSVRGNTEKESAIDYNRFSNNLLKLKIE